MTGPNLVKADKAIYQRLHNSNRAARGFDVLSVSTSRQKREDKPSMTSLLGGESDKLLDFRQECLGVCLDRMQSCLDRILEDLNSEMLTRVEEFVLSCQEYRDFLLSNNLTPTGIVSSENFPEDHDLLFGQLSASISHMDVPGHVFVQLDAEEQSWKGKDIFYKVQEVLEPEYHSFDTIVLCFNNSEALDTIQFDAFLALFESQNPQINLILILATSFSPDILQKGILSGFYRDRFQVSCFQDIDSSQGLLQFLEEIALSPDVVIQPGCSLLAHLVDSFYFKSKSLKQVFRTVKYAYMDHFFTNPISMIPFYNNRESLQELSHEHADLVRFQNSFRAYIDRSCDTNPKKCLGLLQSDKSLFDSVFGQGTVVKRHRENMLLAYEILVAINSALGKAIRISGPDLLVVAQSAAIPGEKRFSRLMSHFRVFPAPDVRSFAKNLLNTMTVKYKVQFQGNAHYEEIVQRLGGIDLSRPLDPSRSDGLKEFFCSKMNTLYNAYQTLPFYELYYLTNAANVRRAFCIQPRGAVHTALADPGHYLASTEAERRKLKIQCEQDDVCIAYQLYLESGTLINLYDWFDSFSSVISSNSDMDEKVRLYAC